MKDIKIDYEGGSIVLHAAFFPASMPDLRSVLRMADAAGLAEEFRSWTEDCMEELPAVYQKGADAARAQAGRLTAEAKGLRQRAEAVRKQEKDATEEEAVRIHKQYMELRARMEEKLAEAADYRHEASRMAGNIKKLERNLWEVETWQSLPRRML